MSDRRLLSEHSDVRSPRTLEEALAAWPEHRKGATDVIGWSCAYVVNGFLCGVPLGEWTKKHSGMCTPHAKWPTLEALRAWMADKCRQLGHPITVDEYNSMRHEIHGLSLGHFQKRYGVTFKEARDGTRLTVPTKREPRYCLGIDGVPCGKLLTDSKRAKESVRCALHARRAHQPHPSVAAARLGRLLTAIDLAGNQHRLSAEIDAAFSLISRCVKHERIVSDALAAKVEAYLASHQAANDSTKKAG